MLPDDAQAFLAELLALCMMKDNPGDQAFMLRGSGANGKSILLAVLLAFVALLFWVTVAKMGGNAGNPWG